MKRYLVCAVTCLALAAFFAGIAFAQDGEADDAKRKKVTALLSDLEKNGLNRPVTSTEIKQGRVGGRLKEVLQGLEELQDSMTGPELARMRDVYVKEWRKNPGYHHHARFPDWLARKLREKENPDVAPCLLSYLKEVRTSGVRHVGSLDQVRDSVDILARQRSEDVIVGLIEFTGYVVQDALKLDEHGGREAGAGEEFIKHLCTVLGNLGDKRAIDVLNEAYNAGFEIGMTSELQDAAEKALARLDAKPAGKPVRVSGFLYTWKQEEFRDDPISGRVKVEKDKTRKTGEVYIDTIYFGMGACRYQIAGPGAARLRAAAGHPMSFEEQRREGLIGAMGCATTYSKTLAIVEGTALRTRIAGMGLFSESVTELAVTNAVWVGDLKKYRAISEEMGRKADVILKGQTMREAKALEEKKETEKALEKYKEVLAEIEAIAAGDVKLRDIRELGRFPDEYYILMRKLRRD